MAKKIVKLNENDLKNIINESIDNIMDPQDTDDNFEAPDSWFAQESDDNAINGSLSYGDALPSYGEGDDEEFQNKIMELCSDGALVFQNIIDVFEHTNYGAFKNYDYTKVLGKIKNICDLIEKIWDSNE